MATNSIYEQLILELINRARLDPAAEAARLGIDLNSGISGGTISTAAKQVLAANPDLVDAARGHSQWMLDTDIFSHTGAGGSSPTARMQAAGYTLSGSWSTGENIAWAGTSGSVNLATYTQRLHDNLFNSAGHRANMLNAGFREAGIGELAGDMRGYNAAIVTENFARSGSKYFVTGVAISDSDGDEFYDIGEGRSGITVSVAGEGSDVTETAGGYKVAVNAGTQEVTFSGGGLAAAVSVTIAAGSANAKVDLAGSNKILSSADTILGSGAVSLSLLGVATLDGTGNGLGNVLRGNRSANTLDGRGGNDIIYGLGGNDVIIGGTGSDTVGYAGLRSDFSIIENADGSFTVIDNNISDGLNEGRDTIRGAEFLRFDGSGETIALDRIPEPDSPPPPDPTPPSEDAPTGEDPPVDTTPPASDPPAFPPVAAVPTTGDDEIALKDGGDAINALAGNDRVTGGDGGDTVRGGSGNDVIFGLVGADTMFGDDGNDVLSGGAGNDRGFGGNGLDLLYGGADNDVLVGGNHADRLYGEAGNDILRGGNGGDKLFGGLHADRLFGDLHNDFLDGGNGNDRLLGGSGNDRLTGGRGNDFLDGDGGRDIAIYAGPSGRYDVDELANGAVRVTDLRGGDGVDVLVDVEIVQFSNGTYLI